MAYSAKIDLPFASFMANANWDSESIVINPFQLSRVTLSPTLPPHMSVDSVLALIGTVSSAQPIHGFSFTLQFANEVPKGDPESGERLDAQSFDIAGSRVMIGTEDGEALAARHSWFRLNDQNYLITNYPITYLTNGFAIIFEYIPPGERLEFHFIIAYNAKASDDCSEWFAVDVPHEQLLQLEKSSVPGNTT